MNLYEFNQMGMQNFPALTKKELEDYKSEFFDWYKNNKDNKYFMLLNRENNYYTIFYIQSNEVLVDIKSTMFKEVVECIRCFGEINDIDYETSSNKECIEFWVIPKTIEGEEKQSPIMFLLFPYDEGVIKI